MLILANIILLLSLILPIFYGLRNNLSFFSPNVLVFGLNFLFIYPYYFSLCLDSSNMNDLVRGYITSNGFGVDYYLINFSILYSFSVLFLFLGLNFNLNINFFKIKSIKLNTDFYLFFGFFSFVLGCFFYFLFLQQNGGFFYVLDNVERRAEFTTGAGYLVKAYRSLILMSVVMLVFYYSETKRNIFLILLVSIISFLIFTSLGGRKSGLTLVVLLLMAWNFKIQIINKFNKYFYVLIPCAIFYVIAIPLLRREDGINYYISNMGLLVQDVAKNLSNVFREFSYIDHYIYIIYKFDLENLWGGASFLDLTYAFIPSKFFYNKPPVDDGAYLRTMVENNSILNPGIPYHQLYQSSWPPETFGNLYMNFWIPGVLVGMFFLGLIYRVSYQYVLREKSILSILMYCSIVFSFHFSNLRIFQTFTDFIYYSFFFFVFVFVYKVVKSG